MLKLTEQEKQVIARYLESDRELPEKHRFLLFEDKRLVELVWKGKISDLCSIVLPFQVIEQGDEPSAEKPEDTGAQLSLFDERGRRHIQLLPGFPGQTLRQVDFRCQNQETPGQGRPAPDGEPATMV